MYRNLRYCCSVIQVLLLVGFRRISRVEPEGGTSSPEIDQPPPCFTWPGGSR